MNSNFIKDSGYYSMSTLFKSAVGRLKEMNSSIIFGNNSPNETELVLGDNFEVQVKDGKTYVVRKKPQYPKIYEECLKILGYNIGHTIPMNHGHYGLLMMKIQRLIIFRDAYWKIAGEQMGLGKPWEPDFESGSATKYVITRVENKIKLFKAHEYNHILAFPTEEMRDAFYDNFKELIEECKELL